MAATEKNDLAVVEPTAQATPDTQTVEQEASDATVVQARIRQKPATIRTRRRKGVYVDGFVRHAAFAGRLRAIMDRQGLTASEVARRIWSTTTDSRGYTVARGRDRIGYYLSGVQYPTPENMEALAGALAVPIDELTATTPTATTPTGSETPTLDNPGHFNNPGPGRGPRHTLSIVQVESGRVRLVVDQMVPSSIAIQIFKLLEAVNHPTPGTVISGDPETPPDNPPDEG